LIIIYKLNNNMAFVFRSELKGTYIPKTDVVGPG
jgi:hypothetical protein